MQAARILAALALAAVAAAYGGVTTRDAGAEAVPNGGRFAPGLNAVTWVAGDGRPATADAVAREIAAASQLQVDAIWRLGSGRWLYYLPRHGLGDLTEVPSPSSLVAVLGGGSAPSSGAPGLPSHLALGLANAPGSVGWMRDSGAAWSFRYQYLAGGANTGNGWSTWNSPPGEFARLYIRESRANGYIPVFTYYQLLQTRGGGGDEGSVVRANLKSAAVMRAYYEDFALLMRIAGQEGGLVIVHVEPDLWGFLQQAATGDDPRSIPASAGSSGYSAVAGLPDDAAGFTQALVRLRDQLAPNALLAYHVSSWAAGHDVGSSRDPNLDVAALAGRITAFYRGLNARFDLAFFDPSDRDAAYYQVVRGENRWWDATNRSEPSFRRFAEFVGRASGGLGLRAMLWQVPIGNTKMRSVNNTKGHYQDNRVEYLLETDWRANLGQFAQAGVIAVLFGRGSGDGTTYDDAAGDGVTNPQPISGNTGVATTPDDDGGYLRERARAYFAEGPLPLP